jgi:hypothetical protein
MDLGDWPQPWLERYEPAFRAHAIEADVLHDLTDQDLEKLGALLGHRRRLLRAIAEHRRRTCGSNHGIVRALGVKPPLRYARWRAQRTLYACTIPNWGSWQVMRWISSPGLYRRRSSSLVQPKIDGM